MLVIVINGSNNSGKDNFVEFFMKHYEFKSVNMSTIDRVKELTRKYFGWDGKKTEPARKFLAEMKRVWAEYNNGPFVFMVERIKEHYVKLNKKDKKNFVYFVHCREPDEIQKFKDKYKNNCLTVLLKREERTHRNKIAENHADMGVNNYNYDMVILNNGSKIDLELESVKFVEKIRALYKTQQILRKQSKKQKTISNSKDIK
jgi:hypothetical protein